MRVAVDGMGGDFAPEAAVQGAVVAARAEPGIQVILVGDQGRMEYELRAVGERPANLEVRHAAEAVGMGEHPAAAVRKKKDASICVCAQMVKHREADAYVSAGNSGAVVAAALFINGRVPGVERPAIATPLPTIAGRAVLLDAGANVDCRALHLAQFGVMGAVYAEKLLGIAAPRVGLLSNGEEETKGTNLTREAHDLLRHAKLQYVGYIEGRDLFGGGVDVIVTDGFTGNVTLKTIEGTVSAFGALLKDEVMKRQVAKLGFLLAGGAVQALKAKLDYAEYGGAPLLGTRCEAVISHGSSTPRAIANAIRVAAAGARNSLAAAIGHALAGNPHLCHKRTEPAAASAADVT